MINRTMRILVMFDLPVRGRKQRKQYATFRKFLQNDSYEMLQYSVYSRITANQDDTIKHIRRLRANLPPEGSVRALSVTEKQYSSIQILVGGRTAAEEYLKPEDMLEL